MAAVQAKDTTESLEAKLALGERLLAQAEMCRKLETEEEKVLPFYAESVTTAEVVAAAAEITSVPRTCGCRVFFPPPSSR
jgi:hypothetical protein